LGGEEKSPASEGRHDSLFSQRSLVLGAILFALLEEKEKPLEKKPGT